MNKEYINWPQIYIGLQVIRKQMIQDNWIPTVIVGINRGGLIPSILLSHKINVPNIPIDVRLRDHSVNPDITALEKLEHRHNKILIIDDINDTGATFQYILNTIGKPKNVKFASIFHNEPSVVQNIDYKGYIINKDKNPNWIVFPWEDWDREENFVYKGGLDESR